MNLSGLTRRKWNYLVLSFLFPFIGMLAVMAISRYKPFGNYSILYSDMYHQYYPFFVAYRKAILSGQSLLYNWQIGMGMDYLGLISYYLASPLNLLSVLVPEKLLLSYFSLLMPVKLGLAGLFYGIFLRDTFRREDFSLPVFSSFYALCAWALGFQWNIMWLDTFALLPLVVLGEISLLRDRKFVLYSLTLFLAVLANYYVGFFVCVFVALVFLCYEICRFPGWRCLFSDLGAMALFSLLALGMTAVLELPTFAALQTTQSSVNAFPTDFRLNIASEHTVMGLLDAMRRVAGNMGGGLEPNFKEGLPNLYCGVGTIALAFLYLVAGEVKLRDKLCAVGLLLFFNVSFIIRQLDYIWHGFHFPNMIPYRFSFLYSFVLLYMAYRGWMLRRRFDSLQIISAALFTAAILCCSDHLTETVPLSFWENKGSIPVYILYNLSFLLLYTGALLYARRKPRLPETPEEGDVLAARRQQCYYRMHSRAAVLGIVCIELIANLTAFGLYFPGTAVTDYPRGREESASMIRYMKEREKNTLFYRAEATHAQTLNDDALNGYNGISAFTSSANVRVTEFLKTLGYGAKNTYNRYCYEESSPVADLFLGLKYLIERDGRDRASSVFKEVHHYGKVSLLENQAYLPLGFLAEPELAEVDFGANRNAFSFQNGLFSAATGLNPDVWYRIPHEDITIEGVDVSVKPGNSTGSCSYSDSTSGSYVTYSFSVDMAGFACVHLNLPKRNDFVLTLNGVDVYRESYSLPQMLAVGDVVPGDVVGVRVLCKAQESGNITVNAAILDVPLFFEGYERLSASVLKLTSFRNTRVEGSILCDRDGLLYTSIPQNGNWHVYVDGAEEEIALVGDCMVAVPLSQGHHSLAFVYRSEAFSLGWKLSLLCGALLFALYCLYYRPEWLASHRKKPKAK